MSDAQKLPPAQWQQDGNLVVISWRQRLLSRWPIVTLSIAISAALVAMMLSRLDIETLLTRGRHVRVEWLLVAALCSVSVLLARGARIAVLVPQAAFNICVAAVSQQQFLNRVTPLRLGELSLPWHLSRHAGESAIRSLAHVVMIRLFDLALVLLTVTAALLLRVDTTHAVLLPLALGLVLTLVSIWAMSPALRWLYQVLVWAALRAGVQEKSWVRSKLLQFQTLNEGGFVIQRRQRWLVWALSVVVLVFQIGLFAGLLLAFDVTLPLLALVQGASVALLGGALPVASVGTIGTQEASWVVGFTWVGVRQSDAILTGIACQVITLVFAAFHALFGALALARATTMAESTSSDRFVVDGVDSE